MLQTTPANNARHNFDDLLLDALEENDFDFHFHDDDDLAQMNESANDRSHFVITSPKGYFEVKVIEISSLTANVIVTEDIAETLRFNKSLTNATTSVHELLEEVFTLLGIE